MADSFEVYEQEFKDALRKFNTMADRFTYNKGDVAQKKTMIEEMRTLINFSDKKLRGMETEAGYLKQQNINAKINKYNRELQDGKNRFNNMESSFMDSVGKKQLFENRDKNSVQGQRQDVKGKYVDANDKAFNQLELLRDAQGDLVTAIDTTKASN
mmetsp:Transcript_34963/g.31510  ORF Transcript_34963/g.31510 Transcript_34963/m.31510 type:complete len:156 (+) Transcript_34963:26-493(+)